MQSDTATNRVAKIKVWDLGVRLFHWLLVAAVAGAGWTGFFGSKPTLDIHLVCGGAIAVLLVWRLVWGGLGSTYARFRSFVVSPRMLLHHVAELLSGRAPAHVGHNPLGGIMVLVLITTLTALVVTGVVVLGGRIKEGPLAPFVSFAAGLSVRAIHELIAYGLLGLIGAHVAGVLVESWRTRENLSGAMVTGVKARRPDAVGADAVEGRCGRALLMAGGIIVVVGLAIVHFSLQPASGMPSVAMTANYARECGACHTPHHPSLAPAATWAGIVQGLDEHFGDNASLAPELAAEIGAYLSANSSERWDSPAANVLRRPDAAEPLRITATAGWMHAHRHVADITFASKVVGGRMNCANCHQDAASGRFAPRAITIPVTSSAERGTSS